MTGHPHDIEPPMDRDEEPEEPAWPEPREIAEELNREVERVFLLSMHTSYAYDEVLRSTFRRLIRWVEHVAEARR